MRASRPFERLAGPPSQHVTKSLASSRALPRRRRARSYVKCNRAVKATALCYAARQLAERGRNCVAAGADPSLAALGCAHADMLARGGNIVA